MEAWDACPKTDWDIAKICANALKGRFRYIGKRKWERYIPESGVWEEDESQKYLRRYIRTNISEDIRERAMYWQSPEMQKHPDTPLILVKLLQLSQRIQRGPVIVQLVRELQEFLDDGCG